METCTHCKVNTAVCTVFCFTPGTDANGIHNTEVLANLCNACVALLVSSALQLSYPENRMSFDEVLSELG